MISRLLQSLACLWLSLAPVHAAGFIINPYAFSSPSAAPEYVAFAAATTTRHIGVPTGTTAGDFMVAVVGAFGPITVTAPAGWTQVGSTFSWQASGGPYSAAILYRVAGASEPATYAFTNGTNNYGYIATYRNASQIDVAGVWSETSGLSLTFAGITSASGSLLLACVIDRANQSLTQPSGMTLRINQTSGFSWRIGLADLLSASNADRTWTKSSTQFNAAGILISIK